MKNPSCTLKGLKLAWMSLLLVALPLTSYAIPWPQEISAPEGTIINDQPQADRGQ